jgi:hypothetical protein
MNQILPSVRYLIVCEDVQTDPHHPRRLTLVGLLPAIRSVGIPPYPLRYRELVAFVQLTECRGTAEGRVEIQHGDSGDVIFRTRNHRLALSGDPLEVEALAFRIRGCVFHEPGLYWVQFWYNDRAIAQQPLLLR